MSANLNRLGMVTSIRNTPNTDFDEKFLMKLRL